MSASFTVHPSSFVDDGAVIGEGTTIWHFSHVSRGARLGSNCKLGQNVFIAPDVEIGSAVKIQNNVSVYTGTIIEDDVFLGPSCVLTNVTNPRSQVNRRNLYERTVLCRGCSIGANTTIICGVTIGQYAFVGAGAVVTKDVPDYALMMGVPARQQGWMSRHGHRLSNPDADAVMVCPESGYRYQESNSEGLRCLDIDENEPLPDEMRKGKRIYDEYKQDCFDVE